MLEEIAAKTFGQAADALAQERHMLAEMKRQRSRLVELYVQDMIELVDYGKEKKRLDDEISQLEASFSLAARDANNILWIAEQMRDIGSVIGDATCEERKKLYQRLFARLDIDLDIPSIINVVPRPWARPFFEVMQKYSGVIPMGGIGLSALEEK